MMRLAFDIGGTFTDFILSDGATGTTHVLKVPTTPSDPSQAVIAGLEQLLKMAGIAVNAIDMVLHATTVATNAVLERKGASTGLITTEGFRDVLIIGRQKRYETYDLYIDKPKPLVRRRHIAEIAERVGPDGTVVRPLEPASLDRAIDAMVASGRQTIAVALLHAYARPEHERTVRERIAARAPGIWVSISSDVSAKIREYERTSSTVTNAYVKPLVDRYLGQLEQALTERGFGKQLFVMQSSGGLISPQLAREFPVRIIESGPAAGILMCAIVGKAEGCEDVITFDMGGTTAKLGAIDAGAPAVMSSFEIDLVRFKKGSGLPINVPAVEMVEIGAGGGSIARIDKGMIVVGPESAGAEPGPICYGKGGTEPTVTDANVVLGYISPDWFNAGAMRLDADAADDGIRRRIGEPLGISAQQAAWGIHLVATSNMENALRLVSVERGRDPRRYALIAFGGAGPLHAARMARSIGILTVIVPYGAGVGSAVGLLEAEPRFDVSATRVTRLASDSSSAIDAVYRALYRTLDMQLRTAMERGSQGGQGDQARHQRWSRYAQMRYAGQGFEIHVDLPEGPIDESYASRAIEAFKQAYMRKHRFLDAEGTIEAVDWTLVATVSSEAAELGPAKIGAGGTRAGTRKAWFPEAGGYVEARVLNRQALAALGQITGPAIIEDPDSTAIILPGDAARISRAGHLIIDIASAPNPKFSDVDAAI
jgi:N-methylhydantoinase A